MERQEFVRRVGEDPHAGGETPNLENCPDVWELSSGDFAVVGLDATIDLGSRMPATASCGPDEALVIVPRATMLSAAKDLLG
jgi:hypothetical protein